jgi:hypothetical protein
MTEWNSDSTEEMAGSAAIACSQPCPNNDGSCALEAAHYARHCCDTDHTHRWNTELPA